MSRCFVVLGVATVVVVPVVGMYVFQREPAFWLSAALVDAAPFLVAALVSSRAASPR